jgi:hypothetical protein
MDNEKEFKTVLQQMERDLMPKNFKSPSSLVKKYGNNADDDFTFMILTASVFMKHERNTYVDDIYEADLLPIMDKISELEKTKYGLKDDEYFPASERPDDIKELDYQLEKILDEKLVQLFRSYNLNNFADLYLENKDKYMARFNDIKDRLKEKKGKSIISIVKNLENESIKCANIKAYNAAAILISSAIEGILYYACSGNTAFTKVLINYNKRKKKNNREKSTAELHFSELVKLANEAGLLPTDKVPEITLLLSIVNNIRNLIHPGRRLSTDYHNIGEDEYTFLYEIFRGLKETYSPD